MNALNQAYREEKKKNEEILRFRKMTSKSKILQTGLKHK